MHPTPSAARYMQDFSCLGSTCPDSCCAAGWRIPVDGATFDRWHTVGTQALRESLRSRVHVLTEAQRTSDDVVAELRHEPGGDCSLLTADKLCTLHAQHGPEMLPAVCDVYPRRYVRTGAQLSLYATLGCPETARLALTDPAALDLLGSSDLAPRRAGDVQTRRVPSEAAAELLAQTARALIRTPGLTARQAWALFGSHVDSIVAAVTLAPATADAMASLAASLRAATVAPGLTGRARAAERRQFETMPLSERLQMAHATAFGAAGLPGPSPVRHLLAHCLAGFDLSDDGEPTARGLQQFARAELEWFEPFDREHPHLLKNYLLNLLGIDNFPNNGVEGIGVAVADVALGLEMIRLLLIGRAHLRRQQFGVTDYVQVVQAYSRYVVR
jgi:lysine-N-methylase